MDETICHLHTSVRMHTHIRREWQTTKKAFTVCEESSVCYFKCDIHYKFFLGFMLKNP